MKQDTAGAPSRPQSPSPLAGRFPTPAGEKSLVDGQLHSFRHCFASMCAYRGVPERVTMAWIGHADSEMVRYHYRLHDEEAHRQRCQQDLRGEAGKQRPGVHGAGTTEREAASDANCIPQFWRGRPTTTTIHFFAAAKCFLTKLTVPIGSPPPWRWVLFPAAARYCTMHSIPRLSICSLSAMPSLG